MTTLTNQRQLTGLGVAWALGALLLGASGRAFRPRRWWNRLGVLDIAFVVLSAGRMNLTRPDSMHPLAVLPLSLLPTLVVPLIIVSHLELFRRERLRSSA